jgi:hypothetical protein
MLFLVTTAFSAPADPLADEISRWQTFLKTNSAESENWKEIKEGTLPLLERAERALNAGQRNLALHILGAIRSNLIAQQYVQEHNVNADTKIQQLEEEWKKLDSLRLPQPPKGLDRVPASVRALAESSFSEVKVYYDASLEYGKNTMPEYGFFYLGLAQAQLDFTRLLERMQSSPASPPLRLPALSAQIDALEDVLLAAYKPPTSIEQHPNFIRTNALIKQARELVDEGLEYGALYKMLYAGQVLSRIVAPGKSITLEETAERSKQIDQKWKADGKDHTIGRIFLEMANEQPFNGENARAVFETILPAYHASLEPSKSIAKKEIPAVTVTLVRWPYT